ncbi:MAG TPA: lysyl oxidase family protein [Gaiellaceae bacterium]|nr:lysyl oxidase family protein [Gaiellaceae bacterium]
MTAPRRHHLTVLLVLIALATVGWPSAAPAQSATPSLRLIGPAGELTLWRFGERVELDLRTWIAATGGDFELRVTRLDYDTPVDIVQVDSATGAVLRDLPEDVLRGWSGLADFVEVSFTDSLGQEVAARPFRFCPNGWERQRVEDTGPVLPRYPPFCGSFSPFTKGMVWGIDAGWAGRALGSGDFGTPRIRLPRAGEFTVTVRIAERYRDLFEISDADGIVTFEVTVRNARGSGGGIVVPAPPSGRRSAVSAAVPDVTDPDPATLPDLVALPLWNMTTFRSGSRDFLGFAATPWNAGPAPLVVEGFRRSGEELMDAYQYFRDEDGNVVGRAPVGEMRYHPHPAHDHWHFLQFARFTLHDVADMEVVRSRKQAYCLAPTDPIDLTVERASWGPGEDLFTACGDRGALWVREVLQTGWGDTYFQFMPGQSFNITNLPNGWYYARIHVNPLGALFETDLTNNVETRLLHLGGRPGARQVLVTPWHGIDA